MELLVRLCLARIGVGEQGETEPLCLTGPLPATPAEALWGIRPDLQGEGAPFHLPPALQL